MHDYDNKTVKSTIFYYFLTYLLMQKPASNIVSKFNQIKKVENFYFNCYLLNIIYQKLSKIITINNYGD